MLNDTFDVIIDPDKKSSTYWKDLWQFRGLFYYLSWRDVLVRYKQTVIGIAWSLIRPLLTMIVFTVIFGKVAKMDSQGIPYLLLVSAGMLPWQFFANAFTEASNSLIANSNMLSKVFFPRIIVPVSAIIVSLVDFFISLIILVGVMLWYNFVPGWQIVFLPLFILYAIVVIAGAGFLIAALNVRYRDFRYIVPFIVQFGLYISPVGFSSSVIPEKFRLLYSLNPMAGVIDGFRWSIFGGPSIIHNSGFLVSLLVSIILFGTGIFYFRRMEKDFADVV